MIAASLSVQRPANAKLLVADRRGRVEHWLRSDFVRLFQAGDLVIANDAATLPASLSGVHLPTGAPVELRLAGRETLRPEGVRRRVYVCWTQSGRRAGGGHHRGRTRQGSGG